MIMSRNMSRCLQMTKICHLQLQKPLLKLASVSHLGSHEILQNGGKYLCIQDC